MLSRVAENLYWTARYMERAEDLARLVNVHSNLILDLPRSVELGWEPLIAITGAEKAFAGLFEEMDERNVTRFLIADKRYPGSILSALFMARENLRSTRDLVPREGWEQVNDLYLHARQELKGGIAKRKRYDFLRGVIQRCQQLTGLLSGTMSHDEAYEFIRIGRNLERADMTTRILDVRSEDLLPRRAEDLTPFENIQWMSVLKSLTAYQMYRRNVRVRVRGADVLRYLLQDPNLPRALHHCMSQVEASLHALPRNDAPLRAVTRMKRQVQEADVPRLAETGLHEFIDDIQVDLGQIHGEISNTYFLLDRAA
ncbi:putative alpha-E superfamily protein [Natronospira proteinivora]|uniref:Alpha-E superfamily protein n=1 Tax=Natronospira proteinivora TaxID=1807133 RepID=A0ABT1G8Q1_9GAMM|nr:alpha-E domain-containing protein [Natronospira proteinivora]MCP1727674.1 putative alpha-E superfamily protein [Natronospira proteinivora]